MYKVPNPEVTIALEANSIDVSSDEKYVQTQNTLLMQRHRVEKSYLVLAKNDFGKVKKRINVGIFNKKTNFILGEKRSLLVWDNHKKEVAKPDTSEIIKDEKILKSSCNTRFSRSTTLKKLPKS